jgi:hypothetical protein
MTNRYGRNQRRRHREEIALLTKRVRHAEQMESIMRSRAITVKQDALDLLMAKYGLIKEAVGMISSKIGDLLGKELAPHASKLLEAHTRETGKPLIDFSMEDSFTQNCQVLRGSIKPIDYNIVIR